MDKTDQEEQLPFVTVIMPVRDEEKYIESSLSSVLEQNYPVDRLEIIVADGMSEDGTHNIVNSMTKKYTNIRLIDNFDKVVPTGLNAAVAVARGDIIVRMDAHCEYPIDYVLRLVALLKETEADNVGGVLVATGSTNYAQKSISTAYYSPISVGQAQRSYKSDEFAKEVDAVWGGCWKKEKLISAGLFDQTMVRNQDDELSFRLRKNGGRIYQDSTIQVRYYVRDSFLKLFKQFIQYGYWKVPVIRKHPRQASIRHLIPPLFVITLISLLLLAPFHYYFVTGLSLITTIYLFSITIAALIVANRTNWILMPGIIWALLMMHFGYGLGFILGIVSWFFGSLPGDNVFKRVTR